VVTQLHATVLSATDVNIFEVDSDYSVNEMLETLQAAAFRSHMPTITKKGEYPGQVTIEEAIEEAVVGEKAE
jgi:hypothetical protein